MRLLRAEADYCYTAVLSRRFSQGPELRNFGFNRPELAAAASNLTVRALQTFFEAMARLAALLALFGILSAGLPGQAAEACRYIFARERLEALSAEATRVTRDYAESLKDIPNQERAEVVSLISQLERQGFTPARIRWEIENAKGRDRCE